MPTQVQIDALKASYNAMVPNVQAVGDAAVTTTSNTLGTQIGALVATPPPVPLNPGKFKSVVLLGSSTTAYTNPRRELTQRLEFILHGSGGEGYSFGESYSAVGDVTMGHDDGMPVTFRVANGGGWGSTLPNKALPWIAVHPQDGVATPKVAMMETMWFGYSQAPAGLAYDYTIKRLDALLDWSMTNFPVDSKQVILTGNSMGGWGGFFYGMRRPDKFAAIFVTLPRWRNTPLGDWEKGTATSTTTTAQLATGGDYTQWMDMVAYVNVGNKIPFLSWVIGKNDGFRPFQDHIDGVAALRAQKRPFVFAWNMGTHSTAAGLSQPLIDVSYDKTTFVLGQGIPVFMNSSRDDALTSDVGGINLGFKWRNVVESASGWSCEVTNVLGPTTCDVWPQSDVFTATQSVAVSIPAANTWMPVALIKITLPPAGTVSLSSMVLNTSATVAFYDQHESSRYTRYQNHTVLTTTAFSLPYHSTNFAAGGTIVPLFYPRYRVYADGQEIGQDATAKGLFTGNLTTQADGPVLLTIAPFNADDTPVVNPVECYPPYWAWIDRTGGAKNVDKVVFQYGSYDWTHGHPVNAPVLHYWAIAPKSMLKPRTLPLNWVNHPTVEMPINVTFPGVFMGGEAFNTPLPKAQLTRLNYAPTGDDVQMNLHHPAVTSRGITVTECIQGYFSGDVINPVPEQPLLDGPRGQATMFSPTALHVGHGGGVYGLDPFSFWKINNDGSKRTIAGIRHKQAPYWKEAGKLTQAQMVVDPNVDVIGDWDASIPVAQRFPWESWGLVFYNTTLDLTATKIDRPPHGPLPPHTGFGPVAYCTCRFGRILKFQFNNLAQDAPPHITVLASGLKDPWGMALDGSVLYVTERGRNAISMWNADTGASLGDLVSSTTASQFGAVSANGHRFVYSPAAYTNAAVDYPRIRKETILGPEGLDVQDGYVYWGSLAHGEIRRINIATKVIEVVCRPYISYAVQSLWLNCKLSNGTFGPRGTVFTTTFDNQYFGRPLAWLPTAGTDVDGTAMSNAVKWDWATYAYHVASGPGGATTAQVYATAVALGNGMLACGSSGPGLAVFMKSTMGETAANIAQCDAGAAYYESKGYNLVHGNYGFGYLDTPLPWGENANMDYWLKSIGHQP